jgi:hypothetical protein
LLLLAAPAAPEAGRQNLPTTTAALEFCQRAEHVKDQPPLRGRSMKQLIETVETLRLRGIGFRSLTEALDTTLWSK